MWFNAGHQRVKFPRCLFLGELWDQSDPSGSPNGWKYLPHPHTHTHPSGDSESEATLKATGFSQSSSFAPVLFVGTLHHGDLCKHFPKGNRATKMPASICGSWEMVSNVNMEGYMIALGKFPACYTWFYLYDALPKNMIIWQFYWGTMTHIAPQVLALTWERLPWSWRWRKWSSRREISVPSKPAAPFGTTPSPSEWDRTLRSSHRGSTTSMWRWANENLWELSCDPLRSSQTPLIALCSVLWPCYSHWWHGRETNWCVSRSAKRRTAAGLTGLKTTGCSWYVSARHDFLTVIAFKLADFWMPLISLSYTGPVLWGRSLQADFQEESKRVMKRSEEHLEGQWRHLPCCVTTSYYSQSLGFFSVVPFAFLSGSGISPLDGVSVLYIIMALGRVDY